MVRAVEEECPCGRPFRVIEAVEGRTEDVLFFPGCDGVSVPVHPNVFHQALELIPASGWQVVQEEDGVSVRITGLKDSSICGPLEDSLRTLLREQGCVVPAVRVGQVSTLERGATGKAPLILCRVKGKIGMSVPHASSPQRS
jgi:phenylacetate-coenzyme A ligase PaaK-like adenylate-forming protein